MELSGSKAVSTTTDGELGFLSQTEPPPVPVTEKKPAGSAVVCRCTDGRDQTAVTEVSASWKSISQAQSPSDEGFCALFFGLMRDRGSRDALGPIGAGTI
jgi:hypothetical protein